MTRVGSRLAPGFAQPRFTPHRPGDAALPCVLLACPRGHAVPAQGSPTAQMALRRRRPAHRLPRRRPRGNGPGRRRRPPGHGEHLPLRGRQRLRRSPGARDRLLRSQPTGPWRRHAGHRAAVRDREPTPRRPVVVRRAQLGRPGPHDLRRRLRRVGAGTERSARAGQGRAADEGPDLSRDELGEEPVRLERARDRQQRRPERRASQPRGTRLPRSRLGRHHPALHVRRQGRPHADLPGVQLDRTRARRSGRTAASRRPRPRRSRSRRSSSASRRPRRASSRISGTAIRTGRRSKRRATRTPSHPRRQTAASRLPSPQTAWTTRSRSSPTGRRSRGT